VLLLDPFSLRSYVAAFILSKGTDYDDPNAKWTLWVGCETKPGVVLFPKQHGKDQTLQEYSSLSIHEYYTKEMLVLHQQTFFALRCSIHNWEEGDCDFSPLFDAYVNLLPQCIL
jgi:hypothetical protein